MVSNIVRIQLIEGPVEGYLDVKENVSFPLNFAISDIRDISSRTGSFSKTIKLAGTKNNNLLLNNYFDVNVKAGTFNVNKIQKVAIIQNDMVIKDNYFLRLLKVIKTNNRGEEIDDLVEYEVQVRDSLGDFFKDIDNKELVDLDSWGLYDHLYTKEAVVNSFDHTWEDGYKYVLPWIGTPDPLNYGLSELLPGIYVKQIFDKIHEQAGYAYEWQASTGSTTQFDKLIIPYSGDKKKLSEEFVQSVKVIANESTIQENESNFTAGVISSIPRKKVDVTNEVVDPSNLYNPTTSTYENTWEVESPNAVQYSINIEWELYFEYSGSNFARSASLGTNPILRYFPKLEVYNQSNVIKGGVDLKFDYVNTFSAGTGTGEWINNGNNIELDSSLSIDIYPGEYIAGGGTNQLTLNATQLNIGYLLQLFSRVNINVLNRQWRNAVTNQPVIVNYGLRIKNISIEIVPTTDSGLLPNSPINLKSFLPKKVKQSEFLKSIYQKYNLYAEVDSQNPNKIIYKSRDEYYDDGVFKNWEQKLDKNQKQELYFVPEISSKKMILSYKDDDNDAGLTAYRGEVGETYAQVEITFENENVRGIERKDEIFSPTMNLPTEFGAVLPILAPDFKMNMRVLIDGGKYTCSDYKISQSTNNTVTLNEYPYMGLLDKPFNPTFSIEYAQPDYYPYNPGVLTQNNLYVNYWRRTLAQINDGKLLKAYFWLTEEDIFKLRLNDKIKVNNALWYINKVVDYDANAHKPTLVELLSVEDDLRLPRFGRIIKPVQPGVTAPVSPAPVVPTGPIRPVVGVIADIIRKRTLATSVFSGYVDYESNQGVRNVLPNDFTGVVVGNDKTITENGFYINDTKLTENNLNIKDEVILGEAGLAVGNTVLYGSNQMVIYDGYISDGYVLDEYFTGSTGSIDFSGDTITLNGNVIIPTGYTLNGVTINNIITGSTIDNYTTGVTLSGNTIIFDRTDLSNAYSVDLSPILTGSTSDIYVTGGTYSSGTLTLNRNDNNDVIVTGFIDGITSLNGLTPSTQSFATGVSGTDFNISSASSTHTFNLPIASATNTGKLSNTDWTTFNNKVSTSRTLTINGTTNQVTVSPTGAQDLSANRTWTLSLPQDIHTAALPTFAGGTFNGLVGIRASALGTTPTQILVVSNDPSSTTRTIQTRTPAQLLTDIGGQAALVNTQTIVSTTTLAATSEVVFVNHTAAINVTLPAATNGKVITIKDISGNAKINNITIIGNIDGTTNYIVDVDYFAIKLVSNGTAWFII
jgi:hypothetical protein